LFASSGDAPPGLWATAVGAAAPVTHIFTAQSCSAGSQVAAAAQQYMQVLPGTKPVHEDVKG
jgi:hypothetical protein